MIKARALSVPLALGAALTLLLLALAGRYGPHRDELYFVAAGHHLAWGYPDQPPMTPALAGFLDTVAPGSLLTLRSVSAVLMGAVVVLAALIARELGGGPAAQCLSSLVIAASTLTMVLGHMLSTATLDTFFWTVLTWLVLRALHRDEPRTWAVVGVVAGLALENKTLVVALLGALVVGIALTPSVRHHLRSPWLLAGAAIAVALWLPNLWWQASQGWPQLDLAEDIQAEYGVLGERIAYVALQLVQVSPLAAPLWIYGVVRLLRDRDRTWARPLGIAYPLLFVAFLLIGGKAYYLAGIMPALVAAGCVGIEQRWPPRRLTVAGVALTVVSLVGWPIGLPLMPADVFGRTPYAAIGEDQAEMVGWPQFASTVRSAVEQTGATVVFTGNHGEAGAALRYGVGAQVFSGHNGFGLWGPPPEGSGPVVVVGYEDPRDTFTDCREVATINNGADIDNEEQGGPVWSCIAPVGGWAAAWPDLRHLSA